MLGFLSFISKGPLDWTRFFSSPDNRQKAELEITQTLCISLKGKILSLTRQSKSRTQALLCGGGTTEDSQENEATSTCLPHSVLIKATEIQTVRKQMQLQFGSLLRLLPVCYEKITSLPFASVCCHLPSVSHHCIKSFFFKIVFAYTHTLFYTIYKCYFF